MEIAGASDMIDIHAYHTDNLGNFKYAYEADWEQTLDDPGNTVVSRGAPTLTENDIDIILAAAQSQGGVLTFQGCKLTGELPLFVTDLMSNLQDSLCSVDPTKDLFFSYLNISYTHIDVKGFECFVSTILRYDNVDSHVASRGKSVSAVARNGLETLICKGNKSLTKEVCILLAQLLTKTTSLRILDFRDNYLGDQGVVTLSSIYSMKLPQVNQISIYTLEILDLSGNDLSDMAILALCRGISQSLKTQALQVDQSDDYGRLNLKIIRLHRNKITDKGAHCLAQLISPAVQAMIHISNTQSNTPTKANSSGRGGGSSARCLPLLELGLNDNLIGSKGINSLLMGLADSHLKVLHIARCQPNFMCLDFLIRSLLISSDTSNILERIDISFTEKISRYVILEARNKRHAVVNEQLTSKPWTTLMTQLYNNLLDSRSSVVTIDLGLLPLEMWQYCLQEMQEADREDIDEFSDLCGALYIMSSPLMKEVLGLPDEMTNWIENSGLMKPHQRDADDNNSICSSMSGSSYKSASRITHLLRETRFKPQQLIQTREEEEEEEGEGEGDTVVGTPLDVAVQPIELSPIDKMIDQALDEDIEHLQAGMTIDVSAVKQFNNNQQHHRISPFSEHDIQSPLKLDDLVSTEYRSPVIVGRKSSSRIRAAMPDTTNTSATSQQQIFENEISSPFDLLTTMKSFRQPEEGNQSLSQRLSTDVDTSVDQEGQNINRKIFSSQYSDLDKREASREINQERMSNFFKGSPRNRIDIQQDICSTAAEEADDFMVDQIVNADDVQAVEIDSGNGAAAEGREKPMIFTQISYDGTMIQQLIAAEVQKAVSPYLKTIAVQQEQLQRLETQVADKARKEHQGSSSSSSGKSDVNMEQIGHLFDHLIAKLGHLHDRVTGLEAQAMQTNHVAGQCSKNIHEIFSRLQLLENSMFTTSPDLRSSDAFDRLSLAVDHEIKPDMVSLSLSSMNQELISAIKQRSKDTAALIEGVTSSSQSRVIENEGSDNQFMDIIEVMTEKMDEMSHRMSSLESALEAEHESSVNVLQILLDQQMQQSRAPPGPLNIGTVQQQTMTRNQSNNNSSFHSNNSRDSNSGHTQRIVNRKDPTEQSQSLLYSPSGSSVASSLTISSHARMASAGKRRAQSSSAKNSSFK